VCLKSWRKEKKFHDLSLGIKEQPTTIKEKREKGRDKK